MRKYEDLKNSQDPNKRSLKDLRDQNSISLPPVRYKTQLQLRIKTALDLQEKAFNEERKTMMFKIWKLRFMLKLQNRKALQMAKMKNGSLNPTGDIRSCKTIAEGGLIVLSYVREQICQVLFEIFMRSITGAHKKKANSLILFIINVREWKKDSQSLLRILLETYSQYDFNLI